ncbi:porin family protein [Aquimarina sediminis]|uniref:porin family protein n=1 Tax=Aquimarina sediminis TaxID=2070536 RepID=UPI000CA017BF|nr:porin family protein [Aquimarina sediminis]
MKRLFVFVICYLFVFISFGQDIELSSEKEVVLDSLYREDQFYVGVTYNLLFNRPKNLSQSGFSGGLHLGFIRDMPINKRRNVAFGLGLGYSFNVYNMDVVGYDISRFTTHLVEAPFEFRWRTSVPETHKFYRIYTGIRMGYMHSLNPEFKKMDSSTLEQVKIEDLNRWRVGATFTFGWNTFNFSFYYSLNTLFGDNAMVEGEAIELNTAKVGLTFYIL